MVSSNDEEYKSIMKCFGASRGGSEDYKHDFLTHQNENQRQYQDDALLTPEEKEKKKEIDDMLSDAMNQLTFDERQRQLDVLHGVEQEIIENPNMIDSALCELDDHILRSQRENSAYGIAERMDPQYVRGKAFRLMFLRCNRYDTKAAAEQMFHFFDIKRQLFGTAKLVKDITLDDLDEHDLESLNSGHFRIIGKDRSNRKILFSLPVLRAFRQLINELRAHFYFKMTLLQSEETQIKGIVVISYEVGSCKDIKNGEGIAEMAHLSSAIPIHYAAVHLAIDDIRTFLMYKLMVKIMPAKVRARLRIHYGSHLECQYRLSTFGISSLLLPIDPNTIAITQRPRSMSEQGHGFGPRGSAVIRASETDVLFTGGRTNDNKGNNRLRSLVEERSKLYDSGSNDTKRLVVDDIIAKIHETGGRFLKLTSDGHATQWLLVSNEELRKKITQRFRNKKRASMRRNSINGTAISDDPLPDDVVFGKAQRSRGKELLKHLVKERYEEYDSLDRGTKVRVVDSIMESIKANGGRFLLPTSGTGGYLEASTAITRERISKYFRNHRRTQLATGEATGAL